MTFFVAADKAVEMAHKAVAASAASGHVDGSVEKKVRRTRKSRPQPHTSVTRVQDIEKEVWRSIQSSFEHMLQTTVSDLMHLGNHAFKHDGLIAASGGATAAVINLDELREQVSCTFALGSGLLERPLAVSLSVRSHMVELSGLAKRVFRVLQVALVESCQRVAAIYANGASIHDV